MPFFCITRRQNLLACGPRILTFFLYLSDVEEGGETKFPFLGHSGIGVFAVVVIVEVVQIFMRNESGSVNNYNLFLASITCNPIYKILLLLRLFFPFQL